MYTVFAKLLEERHVSASALCKAVGISRSTITDWKKGRYTPKADKLQKIADYFGVSVQYLQTGKQDAEDGYYVSQETAKKMHDLYYKYGALWEAAENATAEDVQFCIDFLRRVKGTNKDD